MRPLSRIDKKNAFIAAVCSYANAKQRWDNRAVSGLTDDALIEALCYELGIAGGSSATHKRPSIAYQKAGLKIWASWIGFIPQQTEPIFQGRSTVKMAREVFGIKQPDDRQLGLF